MTANDPTYGDWSRVSALGPTRLSDAGYAPDDDGLQVDGECECGQLMSAHAGGFALLHHDDVMRHRWEREKP